MKNVEVCHTWTFIYPVSFQIFQFPANKRFISISTFNLLSSIMINRKNDLSEISKFNLPCSLFDIPSYQLFLTFVYNPTSMSNNLVDFFQTTIADQLAQTTSGMLGESAASTSSAVRSIFSVLLGSMQRMGNTDQGTQELLSFINAKGIGEEVLTTVQTGLEDPTVLSGLTSSGSEILNFLLGSNLNPVVDQVSTSNGLKTSSASTLLKIIAPIVMSLVSGVVKNKTWVHRASGHFYQIIAMQ